MTNCLVGCKFMDKGNECHTLVCTYCQVEIVEGKVRLLSMGVPNFRSKTRQLFKKVLVQTQDGDAIRLMLPHLNWTNCGVACEVETLSVPFCEALIKSVYMNREFFIVWLILFLLRVSDY